MARPVPSTAVEAVERGLVTVALLWQVLWAVSQPVLWPQAQPNVASRLAIVATIAAWALLVAWHVISPSRGCVAAIRANVAALAAASLVLSASTISTGAPGLVAVAEVGALAAGIAGILIPGRFALAVLGAALSALVWTLVDVSSAGTSLGIDIWLLDPAYVLAVGLAAVASRRALLRGAQASDVAASRLLVAVARRRTAEAVEASLRASERLLHEQVLNTLIAIARGGIETASVERLRERSAEGARLLRSLRTWGESEPETSGVAADASMGIETILEDLAHAGVESSVELPDLSPVPAQVQEAFRGAVHEALRNVLRHAQARHVTVNGASTGSGSHRVIEIRVSDDGRGLPAEQSPYGFGVQDAILGPMVEVGGTAEIRAGATEGVEVILTWGAAESAPIETTASFVPRPSALSIPVLGALSVYVAAMVVASWGEATSGLLNGLALTVWVTVAVSVGLRTHRTRLGWPSVVAVAAAGWVVYSLQGVAFSDGSLVAWASPAIAALFLVAAATGPGWGWVVLVGVWLVFQGDPLHELTQPGTVMILVGAVLNRSLLVNAQRASQRAIETTEQAMREATALQRLDRLAQRFAGLDSSCAADMLESLAEAGSDPGRPEVRDQAMREERYLRNILKTDPSVDALHAAASDLIRVAHERNVLLAVHLSAGDRHEWAAPDAEVDGLRWALGHADPTRMWMGQPEGHIARLTSFTEGSTMVLRLVAELGVHGNPPFGVMIEDSERESALWMGEARWMHSST